MQHRSLTNDQVVERFWTGDWGYSKNENLHTEDGLLFSYGVLVGINQNVLRRNREAGLTNLPVLLEARNLSPTTSGHIRSVSGRGSWSTGRWTPARPPFSIIEVAFPLLERLLGDGQRRSAFFGETAVSYAQSLPPVRSIAQPHSTWHYDSTGEYVNLDPLEREWPGVLSILDEHYAYGNIFEHRGAQCFLSKLHCRVGSAKAGNEALRPQAIKDALSDGKRAQRQGDIFVIETNQGIRRQPQPTYNLEGHLATYSREANGQILVGGTLRHPQHTMLRLGGKWWEAHHNAAVVSYTCDYTSWRGRGGARYD